MCRERRLLRPDRRVLDGRQDDQRVVHVGVAQRNRTAHPTPHDRAFRSRQPRWIQPVVGLIARNTLRGSMGRVGACADTAAMESFFSLLQKNVLNRQRWETRQELRIAIITWIERTYHRRRRQRRLGRLTPIEV